MNEPKNSYLYQITYSDGTEFEKAIGSMEKLRDLHRQIELLTSHMNKILEKK